MALYVSQAELETVGLSEIIDMVTDGDDSIVETIILETMDVFRSYMGALYDMDMVYAETGEDRSKVVMKYMKDVAIYEIYIRKTKEINEVAKLRYDEAMLWLDKVSKGQLDLELPFILGEDEDGDGNPDGQFFFYSGNKSYKNDF